MMQPREGGYKKAISASGTLYFSTFHDIYKENTSMRHLRKYVDESGFTEPVEIVEKKIGFYAMASAAGVGFVEAVKDGNNYVAKDIVFADGFGFYLISGSSAVKIETGEEIQGEIQPPFGSDMWHYKGFTVLNSETLQSVVQIEEYENFVPGGSNLWIGFSSNPPSTDSGSEMCAYLKEHDVTSTRQNAIVTLPDIWVVNILQSGFDPVAVKVKNNGDGTYTSLDNQTTYTNDSTHIITHPYVGGTKYQFKVNYPGVGYIKEGKKVTYNSKKEPSSFILLKLSDDNTKTCTIPINNGTVDITQEELRKLVLKLLPDSGYSGDKHSRCRIDLKNYDFMESGITIDVDTEGKGDGIQYQYVSQEHEIWFEVYDLPGYRNDVLHLKSNTSYTEGIIHLYYTDAPITS